MTATSGETQGICPLDRVHHDLDNRIVTAGLRTILIDDPKWVTLQIGKATAPETFFLVQGRSESDISPLFAYVLERAFYISYLELKNNCVALAINWDDPHFFGRGNSESDSTFVLEIAIVVIFHC